MKTITRTKYLESSEKFYLCDSGIRYAILEAEIWTMAEFMRISFASNFFAVDTMSMSAVSFRINQG